MPFEDRPTSVGLPLTDPAGPGALLIGLAALGCVWVPRLSGLVVPLGIFGLLWGVIALAVAGSVGRPRGRAALGTVVSAAVLGIAIFPSSVFRWSAAQAPAAAPAVSSWTNASRGEQKQGGVGLQVISAELGTAEALLAPPTKSGTPPKSTPAREKVVTIRLRAMRTGDRPADDKSAGIWREKPRASLMDDSGHKLAQRPAVMPGGAEAVLVFEAPPRIRKFLRLEVPGAIFGSPGSFRFLIPTGMVRADIAEAGKPGG
jgi:hypothetical protein